MRGWKVAAAGDAAVDVRLGVVEFVVRIRIKDEIRRMAW